VAAALDVGPARVETSHLNGRSSASRSTSDFWFYNLSGPRIGSISQLEAFGFAQPFDKLDDLRVIGITGLWPRETEQVLRSHSSYAHGYGRYGPSDWRGQFPSCPSVVNNFKMISDLQTEEARDHGMPCLVKGSAAKVFIAHCRELFHWFFFSMLERAPLHPLQIQPQHLGWT